MVIPSLLAGLIVFLVLLIRDPGFDRRKLWLPDGFLRHLKPIVVRLIIGGAVLFLYLGLVHIFFFNAWALILSTIEGILFAWTYHRSGSILFSSIEHGNLR